MFKQSSDAFGRETAFVQQTNNSNQSQDKQNAITYGDWERNLSPFAIKLVPSKHEKLLGGKANVICLSQMSYLLNSLLGSVIMDV